MSSEREDALRAELVSAARDLHEAQDLAHPTAPRCRNCGHVDTPRIRDAEVMVLMRARALAEHLAKRESA